MNTKPSPCDTCTRVKDPDKCKVFQCLPWRVWWKARWDATCLFLLSRLK